MIKNKELATSMISKKSDDIAEEHRNKANAIFEKYGGGNPRPHNLKKN